MAATLPAGAVPPAAVGALASSNVDLVATIPDAPAIGGRFLGDTLYVTTSQGLRIYDTAAADGIPVPLGALELPHFENEDVDTDGRILLISADHAIGLNMLYVIDVSNPMLPMVVGTLPNLDQGHTISCIMVSGRCDYAYIAGGHRLPIIDLRNPAAPKRVGELKLPDTDSGDPGNAGGSHDIQPDATGIAWISAGGGLFGYDTSNPLDPTLIAANYADADHSGPELNSNFIIHNSWRPNAQLATTAKMKDGDVDPGELLLVTEEDYMVCAGGAFQTAWLRIVDNERVIQRLDSFMLGNGTVTDGRKPGGGFCSSHYFGVRPDGIVAVGWYEQGTRFLDVSNPRDIRQVGYYLPAVTETWNAQWHDGRLYTFDVARGIDVLTFSGAPGSATVLAPRYNSTLAPIGTPDPAWGYACRRLFAPAA